MKLNACISIISSRTKCLKRCLKSLYDFYNYRYNYPVHIYYFDDIYDSKEYQDDIHKNINNNIHFINVPYHTPKHIKEEELYYNRKNIQYVRKKFSIERKGYLHMCHFMTNFYGYPNTKYEQYDFMMSHDDESGYIKELPYDPFEVMNSRKEDMGALIIGKRLKNGKPHQGHLDTRIGLWDFTKNFLISNNIKPKSELLQNLLNDNNAEWNFHFLPWADSYVIKSKMFKTDLWKKWIFAVNENGGIYKYRWGDNEIMSLFYLIYDNNLIYNLKTVEEGYHNQGLFRKIQNTAPNIKNRRK